MSNELRHYGVLGMKWGVRRSKQPGYAKTPTYSNEQDKLVKGSKVYRVSSRPNEIDSGRTFVFADENDADKFAEKILELNPGSKAFKMTMKVQKNMIGPSEKERVDNFLEMYKNQAVATIVNQTRQNIKGTIDVRDKDGDKTLPNYRAYTIAVAKNVSGLGVYALYKNAKGPNFDMQRDDYMRGFTKLTSRDKKPIDSLDSAYMVFSRGDSLKTISSEEYIPTVKHMEFSPEDSADRFYPGYSFSHPGEEITL